MLKYYYADENFSSALVNEILGLKGIKKYLILPKIRSKWRDSPLSQRIIQPIDY